MPFRTDGALSCPHCDDASLSRRTIQWIPRHGCRGCDGAWFDRDDLLELAKDVGVEGPLAFLDAAGAASARRCPRCAVPMAVHSLADDDVTIAIDVCAAHGMWFDRDELAPMLDALMKREDQARSPFARTERPWWAATLSFVFTALASARRPMSQ